MTILETVLFFLVVAIGYIPFIVVGKYLIDKMREESNERRRATTENFINAINAIKAKTAEDFVPTVEEEDSPLPEQENEDLVDMYNVDENILIEKLKEENDSKQNKN